MDQKVHCKYQLVCLHLLMKQLNNIYMISYCVIKLNYIPVVLMGCSYVKLLIPFELSASTIKWNYINDFNIHICVSIYTWLLFLLQYNNIVFSLYLYHLFLSSSIYNSTKLLSILSATIQAKRRVLEKL